jgi:hypothetical protein
MKKLIVYDVDDTLFFANQKIGMEVDGKFKWMSQQEFHEHDIAGTVSKNLDFSRMLCSHDFIKNLKPNMIAIKRLIRDIERADAKIVVMTARHEMSDIPLYISAFHDHGVNTDDIEFIFAGVAGEAHWSSHEKKKVFFDKFFEEQYDHVTVYDDNVKNLETVQGLALDYPFTTVEAYRVFEDGTINRYNGCE